MSRAFLLALLFASAAAAEPRSFLLVAKKDLRDPFFSESVVLVVKERAPLGVILNKPLDATLAKAFKDNEKLAARDDRLFFGGPVKRNEVVFVFRAATPPANSVEVLDGIYLSANAELLRELLKRDDPVEGLRVYAGHAGWAPGQLESEIERGSWHVVPASARHVFTANPKGLWRALESRASSTTAQGPTDFISSFGSYTLPSFTTR